MNAQVKRALLPILRDVKAGKPPTFRQRSAAEWILHKLKKPSPMRNKPSAQRKEAKAAQHREETGALREAVFARAGGRCEYHYGHEWVLRCEATAAHLDHWLHGIGRRRQKQSLATCWALCLFHHDKRTASYPSAAYWNTMFKAHCDKHGYPFQPHIEHQPVPRRANG